MSVKQGNTVRISVKDGLFIRDIKGLVQEVDDNNRILTILAEGESESWGFSYDMLIKVKKIKVKKE